MIIFEKFRKYLFWSLDFFTGGEIASHLKDIKFILEDFYSEESLKKRNELLLRILNHSVETVPNYFEYKSFKSIKDFPVIDKIILRESSINFISKKYINKKGYETFTSGSTGTPLKVIQDKSKKKRNTADTIYFGRKAGYELGQTLFYFRAWNSLLKKSRITTIMQNVKAINVKNLDNKAIELFIKEVEKGKTKKAFIGYSSVFREICKYLDSIKSRPIDAKISSMIATSELLSQPTINAVKKYFNFKILSRYSNTENGIISQQIINEGNEYHINWASYYIEILELDSNKSVEYGKIGRVVVTDLFNYHMPIIRYDTGDLAVIEVNSNNFNGAPYFLKIEGRRMDTIYDTKGRVMTTAVYELEHFPEFKQFQLIQEEKIKYCVKINVEGVFKHEEKLRMILKKHLGNDAIIAIEYVDEVPQLASGKRKLTLNKYKV